MLGVRYACTFGSVWPVNTHTLTLAVVSLLQMSIEIDKTVHVHLFYLFFATHDRKTAHKHSIIYRV